MAFNFKDTKSATSTEFMKPGVYRFKIVDVKFDKFPKGTPYLEVIFKTKEGKELSEKFAITENSINRIQYLHENWLGKACATNFETEKEVFVYMKKKLLEKAVVKSVIVGGDDLNGRVFAHLPYTGFIDNEGKLEVGEFEKNGEEWKEYVIKKDAVADSKTANKPNGLLNDDADEDLDDTDEDTDDWGDDETEEEKPKGKKKPEAKPTKKEAPKTKAGKKGKPEPEPEDEEIEDEEEEADEAADDKDEW